MDTISNGPIWKWGVLGITTITFSAYSNHSIGANSCNHVKKSNFNLRCVLSARHLTCWAYALFF